MYLPQHVCDHVASFRAFLGRSAQQQINGTLLGNGLGSVEGVVVAQPGVDVPALRDHTYQISSHLLWMALVVIAALMVVCLLVAIVVVCSSWRRSLRHLPNTSQPLSKQQSALRYLDEP